VDGFCAGAELSCPGEVGCGPAGACAHTVVLQAATIPARIPTRAIACKDKALIRFPLFSPAIA